MYEKENNRRKFVTDINNNIIELWCYRKQVSVSELEVTSNYYI